MSLTFGRVFETKVRDGTEKLGLEKEVTETCRVDADVRALLDGRSRAPTMNKQCGEGGKVEVEPRRSKLDGEIEDVKMWYMRREDGERLTWRHLRSC